MSLFHQMAGHIAQLGTAEYEQNLANCKQLFDLWKLKTPVFITAEDPKESNSIHSPDVIHSPAKIQSHT